MLSQILKDPGHDLTLLPLATITLTMDKVWIGESKVKSSVQSRVKIKTKCQEVIQGRWMMWVLKVLLQIQAIQIWHWSWCNVRTLYWLHRPFCNSADNFVTTNPQKSHMKNCTFVELCIGKRDNKRATITTLNVLMQILHCKEYLILLQCMFQNISTIANSCRTLQILQNALCNVQAQLSTHVKEKYLVSIFVPSIRRSSVVSLLLH